MQTTLLGLAIAFIIALTAALVGPYFVDWNQFRPQFEAEATRIVGAPVRVGGELDARLLPAPSLRLRSVSVGGANDLGKVRAEKLDVEFSLGSLMRGEWRATELTVNGMSLDLGLDPKGRIDWPASTGAFNLGSLAIDRLNLTGRVALHDASSRGTLELSDIAFSGDVRSLAGSIRGDGNFLLEGTRYPFRVSSGQSPDSSGTRVHLTIDPGQRPLSLDLDGVLAFEARAPRFEGTAALAAAIASKPRSGEMSPSPWRVTTRVKVDPSVARLEQIEVSYGAEERALKLSGSGELRFGASPLLRAGLSARQLDADRLLARDNAEPVGALATLRSLFWGMPPFPVPSQIDLSSEQIMLGGRPLQDIAAELRGDGKSWTVSRMEFRAPGATKVALSGVGAQAASPGEFKAALNVESADPDTLMNWLQGRGDMIYRGQKSLRLLGDITAGPNGFAIDAMKAEIEAGAVEGRLAFSSKQPDGSRIEAELKGERLDLDVAAVFVRSLAGSQAEWPDQAQVSLNIVRAISAGQELRPLMVRLGYDPKTIALEQLKIGQPDGVTLEGSGSFDRVNATGRLALDSTAPSLGQLARLMAPFAPTFAARLDALDVGPGPARARLSLDLDGHAAQVDRTNARAVLEFDAPQLKGVITATAKPPLAAIRGIDLDALGRSEIGLEAKLSSAQPRSMLLLLGLDRVVTAGEGPAQFEATLAGAFRSALRLKAKILGTGLDADVDGSAEPWAPEVKAGINLKVRSADLGPLLYVGSSPKLAQNVALSTRVALAGNRLVFDDLDSAIAGSRLRGRLAFTLDDEKGIEGTIGLDQIALAPAFALAIGASGHDAAEPLAAGLTKGWRGAIAFQSLRGLLPGGGELQPVSGILRGDGQSLTLDAMKGKIGGGNVSANIDIRHGGNGINLNASVELGGVEGSALRYRNLMMPKGRASMQMTLMSQGRSASALVGALSGSGTLTLEQTKVSGLDPRVFELATRASDSGQMTDDARLKQIVEPVLSAGALWIAPAQIPFNIRDGRLRVGATTLDGIGARAIVSGGYDIPADQVDIRAALASTAMGTATSRPEIQLFLVGTPDALDRTLDVTALSSWLAVRVIDRETRRLDAIERGERPPAIPKPTSASIPPASDSLSAPEAPHLNLADPPLTNSLPSDLPPVGPRRQPPRPRAGAPHPPPLAPPAVNNGPVPNAQAPAPAASQPQVAPLPPPIDVRPAPGAKPKLRPPLALTPQVANPPPRPAF